MTVRAIWDGTGTEVNLDNVRRRHSPEQGTIVMQARVAEPRDTWVYRDLLNRLGKTHYESEIVRSHANASVYATAWGSAHEVKRLVVTAAESLSQRNLTMLAGLAGDIGADLVLFGQGGMPLAVGAAIRNWMHEPGDMAQLDRVIPAPATSSTQVVPADGDRSVPAVPSSTFMTFRADTRQLLAADDFALVDAIYIAAFHDAEQNLIGRDELSIAAYLGEQLASTSDENERTVIIRATQAAAFRDGIYFDADPEGILKMLGAAGARTRITNSQWAQLNSAARPMVSALAAMSVAGIDPAALLIVRRHDVATDGSRVHSRGQTYEIPPQGRLAVRAQHIVHAGFGHAATAPFLQDSSRTKLRDLTGTLNELAAAFQIPLRLAHTPSATTLDKWRYRCGVTVKELAS